MEEVPVIIKEYALNQLRHECLYYAENYSSAYAEKFRVGFFKQIETIAPDYFKYPECRFLTTKNQIYRNIIWKNYLIVYKVKKNVIEVLCLFHTSLHPKKLKKLRKIK